MGKYQGYERYKDSGVEWLGEIPEHWEVYQVKRITQSHKQGFYTNQSYVNEGVKLARITDIDDFANISFEKMPFVEIDVKDERAFEIKDGDFLFARSGTIGRFGLVRNPERAIFASYLISFRFKDNSPEYLRFYFASDYFKKNLISTLHGGANQNVHAENIKEQFLPIPPLEEQNTIAQFLDHKTSQIDALIAKKEALLKKLDEKRTALISHAVTKGLDPTVPMKDSGIEWLGDIPAHWEVIRIKRAFVLQRGIDIRQEDQTEGVVPVVSSGGIASYHNIAYSKAPGVLVGRKGTVGNVHYVDVDYWPHDTTLWVIEFYDNNPRFIYYKLLSMDLENWDTGSANPTLNRNLIHPLKTSWISPEEQTVIAKYLDKITAEIDQQKAKIKQAIDLLKEYRTALITNAVTGKIDVRQVLQ
ncbi:MULTISPECIES: restriction endonuclease subunit S [unclassified Coleofasciculus]|uniref:restriction endonuclease subunit S n=1 Tax=unclassified Coleofasciculus TaxID=2692782 RepID=UPI001882EC6F|nr:MULTISPECIES: restriction endonuclease subunit S [unclassified Coleofasciculus]MBE9128860.1 restriction endonuclease subunit S [Coleofasciculus sp. LEGE 07081]MBE9151620.1 restriction endonuclease subunit S [Coleofasciculus sp. LEGE 07092]